MALDFLIANSQNVDIGTDAALDPGAGPVAMSAWCKTDIGDAVDASVMNKGGSSGGGTRYKLNYDGNAGRIKWEIDDNGASGEKLVETVVGLNDGKWHHIFGLRDTTDNEIRIYHDGELDASLGLPVGYGSLDSSDPGTLGSAFSTAIGDFEFFTGLLADLRIYIGRNISDAEIKHIYNSFGHDQVVQNLVARYMMNERSRAVAAVGADSVRDSGPNGLHGTPANSPIYAYTAEELNFIDRSMR